jgi:hypothetical protein
VTSKTIGKKAEKKIRETLTVLNDLGFPNRYNNCRSNGGLYGPKTKIPRLLRINLNIFKPLKVGHCKRY